MNNFLIISKSGEKYHLKAKCDIYNVTELIFGDYIKVLYKDFNGVHKTLLKVSEIESIIDGGMVND
ncbi:hypothetical protein MUA82_10695 [Staphylococcus simulans]|uniref:hypothetical protein n=1 Tax=Staphylococcus simulans TaxID=1286 RepID=UPI0021D1E552|nr:hypothetical protein [Staphylococcus simulans]UXR51603.1 hypothetical protein MUA82_08165 [Staphylococcus simulans]UXR52091.1 hypothetical protein MUA82_10695 [Staphylococcus simulans]